MILKWVFLIIFIIFYFLIALVFHKFISILLWSFRELLCLFWNSSDLCSLNYFWLNPQAEHLQEFLLELILYLILLLLCILILLQKCLFIHISAPDMLIHSFSFYSYFLGSHLHLNQYQGRRWGLHKLLFFYVDDLFLPWQS